jgi:hypothetical protein
MEIKFPLLFNKVEDYHEFRDIKDLLNDVIQKEDPKNQTIVYDEVLSLEDYPYVACFYEKGHKPSLGQLCALTMQTMMTPKNLDALIKNDDLENRKRFGFGFSEENELEAIEILKGTLQAHTATYQVKHPFLLGADDYHEFSRLEEYLKKVTNTKTLEYKEVSSENYDLSGQYYSAYFFDKANQPSKKEIAKLFLETLKSLKGLDVNHFRKDLNNSGLKLSLEDMEEGLTEKLQEITVLKNKKSTSKIKP